jgi:hypothetical protein
MRKKSIMKGVPTLTTISAADAAVKALQLLKGQEETVQALQDYFA